MYQCFTVFLVLLWFAMTVGCRPRDESMRTSMATEFAEPEAPPEAAHEWAQAAEKEAAALESSSVPGRSSSARSQALSSSERRSGVSPSSRKRPGTLRLTVEADDFETILKQPGPWLYVNHKLVKKYHGRLAASDEGPRVTDELSLLPGTYDFELAIAVTPGDPSRFILEFERWRMTIEPDHVATYSYRFGPVFESSKLGPHAVFQQIPATGAAQWYLDQEAKAERTMTVYGQDPLVAALRQFKAGYEARLPDKPVFRLDLPEKYGGAREMDWEQVYWIAHWLNYHYWHDWPNVVPTPVTASESPEELQVWRQWQKLDAVVHQHRELTLEYAHFAQRLPPSQD